LLCDRSAKRFAQDDDFVGELEIKLIGYPEKHKRIEKVRGSQDDDFVGVLKKNIPNKFALMRIASWAIFSRPQWDSS
jgi:hypothetical protein